jgi:hypothetical protein
LVSAPAIARARIAARPAAVRRGLSDGTVVLLLALALYLLIAAILVFKGNAVEGDGISRVGIANRILFSRDPHLAAIGFVWSPLPILVLLPLIPFKFLWPALVQLGFAGNIVSSLFMAGACLQVLRFLEDSGVGRRTRLTLTACFALHPMIVWFGANSMSEAQFIFLLLLTTRHLTLWMRSNQTGELVATGLYLGLAYLTRYEAAAAAAAVLLLVAVASCLRNRGAPATRIGIAAYDCLIVGSPFVVAFVAWAVISWAVTGVALQQFSSAYGNAAQLHANGITRPDLGNEVMAGSWGLFILLAFEPLLPVVAMIWAVRAVRGRRLSSFAGPMLLGAVLVFMFWAYVTETILRDLRYFIVVIPLAVIMVGISLAPVERRIGVIRVRASARRRSVVAGAVVVTTLLAMVVSLPPGAYAVLSPATNQGAAYPLLALVNTGTLSRDERLASERWTTDRAVAAYLDSMHLNRGSVLVDDFLGFVIVMASDHPEQFVSTADRDFQSILSDPADSDVQYLLVPPDSGLGSLDALNRTYPQIYETGGGIAKFVKQFNDVGDYGVNWRLYRVLPAK